MQPESHQMAPLLGLGMILEGCSVMKNPAIIDQEDLPRSQAKLNLQVAMAQRAIEHVESMNLLGR